MAGVHLMGRIPPCLDGPPAPGSRATDSPAECLLPGRPSPSPKQFQAELDLARCGGAAGAYAGSWGNARGRENDGGGLVEVGAGQTIEFLRAALDVHLLPN